MTARYMRHTDPMPGDEARSRGEKVCRWCVKRLGKGRRVWCSEVCAHQYMIRSSGSWMRTAVFQRDKGVCAECGFDSHATMVKANALFYSDGWIRRRTDEDDAAFTALRDALKARGFRLGYSGDPQRWRSLWEADHIKPVVDGGGQCGIENIRTLCVPCHKRASKALAARRAAERKAARPKRSRQKQEILFGGNQ